MNFSQIMKFLDNGLSVEEIEKIIDKEKEPKNNDKKPDEKSTQKTLLDKSDVPAPDININLNKTASESSQKIDEPAWAQSLLKSITDLTKTVQANAIMNTSMKETKTIDEITDEILANIINPKE